ncbi:hypothetical protein EDD21DRAFT_302112 [Dissophora ornata]|nr:hypothetical protein EDD21DRAFT_302112 [Dissophora ornata]
MAETTRYRLRVSAGPSADPNDLKPIVVNDDANPMLIESDEFIGQIVVRIRGLDKAPGYEEGQKQDGLETHPESLWFSKPGGDKNLSSVQISGRFKREWPGHQVVFGNQFERPLRLPPLSSIALRFIQFIDPGLKADLYCDRPWAFSPLIATMNTVNKKGEEEERIQKKEKELQEQDDDREELVKTKSGNALAATTDSLNSGARRSYFAKEANLAKHRYRPDQVYGFDFFNPYVDFANFTLRVPGFSVDITKYWDGQPLTYIIKSQDSSVVFLAFQFELIPIKDIATE